MEIESGQYTFYPYGLVTSANSRGQKYQWYVVRVEKTVTVGKEKYLIAYKNVQKGDTYETVLCRYRTSSFFLGIYDLRMTNEYAAGIENLDLRELYEFVIDIPVIGFRELSKKTTVFWVSDRGTGFNTESFAGSQFDICTDDFSKTNLPAAEPSSYKGLSNDEL